MNVVAIPYGPKWTTAFAGLAIAVGFGAGAASLLLDQRSLANSNFARFLGPTLSVAGIAIGLVAFILIALAALYVLYISLSRSRLIVLYDDHFTFPHGLLFGSVSKVPYSSIIGIAFEPLGTKLEGALKIRCTNFTLLVVEPLLPSSQHLKLLYGELAKHAQS